MLNYISVVLRSRDVRHTQGAKELLNRVLEELKTAGDPFDFLNNSINQVFSKIETRKDLREISSLISAKALAISAKYVEAKGGE